MENNEQTPQLVEKPEAQTPAEEKVIEVQPESQAPVAEKVSAEKPEGQAPVAEQVSAEKPERQASVKQEVCNEKAGTVNESPGSKEVNKDARMWAMLCHLAGLCALIPIVPVIGGVIGTLIIWQIKTSRFSPRCVPVPTLTLKHLNNNKRHTQLTSHVSRK